MKKNLKFIASLACIAAVVLAYMKLALIIDSYMLDEFYSENARGVFTVMVNLLALPAVVYGAGALIHIFKLNEQTT